MLRTPSAGAGVERAHIEAVADKQSSRLPRNEFSRLKSLHQRFLDGCVARQEHRHPRRAITAAARLVTRTCTIITYKTANRIRSAALAGEHPGAEGRRAFAHQLTVS